MRRLAFATLCSLTAAWPETAAADQTNVQSIDEIVVFGRAQQQLGSALSASEGLVGYDDLRLAPMLRVGELAETVPGMVATQHSGTGKANQYFMRGFNLDHGTDFAASADGVPLNLRTHGHGHGYLDLSFLIPELVATSRYRKGPYSARVGDFSSAGSVEFGYYDRLEEAILSATVGGFDYYRGLAAGSFDVASGTLTGAVDVTRYDGPWDLDENLRQDKFHLGYASGLGGGTGRLTLQGYEGRWTATDQVPRRAVASGRIGARGFIDPDLGGESRRYSLTGAVDFEYWEVTAYVIDYELELFSNFTYFLDDPAGGDEFEQTDDRTVWGGTVTGAIDRSFAGRPATFRWGAEIRNDDIDEVGLYDTGSRIRNAAVRRDRVKELSVGGWGEAEVRLTERLRAVAGLRADWYDWDVDALQAENSGAGNDRILSPKLGFAYRLGERVEGYANWGRSFHSNDVRGATIATDPVSGDPANPVPPLVRSEGGELGLRYEARERVNATLAAFWLALDSELVFVGDAGTTEPNDATERYGVELAGFWQAADWLAVHAACTATHAEFRTDQGGGREIPGAVRSTFSLGLDGAWQNGISASLRLRYLGDAPLTEDGSVRSDESLLVNAGLSWRRRNVELRADGFNLFDSDDQDIAYFYASRLPGEPAEGIEDIHYHPLEPRTVRVSVSVFWE